MSQSFAFPTTLYLVPGALQALSDVSVNPGSAQEGNPLVWNNTTTRWEAGTIPRVNGLRFPATQVANADPNTFDDYEEGFFTPALVDASSFDPNAGPTGLETSGYTFDSSTTGVYTKTGNIVTYTGFIGINGKPGRSSDRGMYCTIPFLGSTLWFAETQPVPNSISSYSGSWSIGTAAPLKVASYAALTKSTSFSTGTTQLTLGDLALGSRIIFSFSYLAN